MGLDEGKKAAFVTFRTLLESAVSTQSQVSSQASTFIVSPAPEPRAVRWHSIGVPIANRWWRFLVVQSSIAVIYLFWGVFTAFVGAASSTAELANRFDWVKHFLLDYPEAETVQATQSRLTNCRTCDN